MANLLVPDLIAYHKPSTVSGLPAVAALQNPTVARGTSTNAFNVFRRPHRDGQRLERGPEPRYHHRHKPH